MGSVGKNVSLLNRSELDTKLEEAGRKKYSFAFLENTDLFKDEKVRAGEEYKHIADEILNYLQENNLPIITQSADYDDMIVWYYSGTDRDSKRFITGEVSDYPTKSQILSTIKNNGLSPRIAYPKNIADYLINNTEMSEPELKVADMITTQALKEWKNRRKK